MKPLALPRRHPGPETERKWDSEEGCGEGGEGEGRGMFIHISDCR